MRTVRLFKNFSWTDVLCWTGTAVALYVIHRHFKRKKRINELLVFGVNSVSCPEHRNGPFFYCGKLNCDFGRVGYLRNLISSAKETVEVCIFIIAAPLISDIIVKAHLNGVKVRVVTDAEEAHRSESSVNDFRRNEIPVRHKMCFPSLMHHKFIIIDRRILITGSSNFTMTAMFGNIENVVITEDVDLVLPFITEFEELWNQFSAGSKFPTAEQIKLGTVSKKLKNSPSIVGSVVGEVVAATDV